MQSSAKQISHKSARHEHQTFDAYIGELPHLMWGPPATKKNEEKVDILHGLQPAKTSVQCQLERRIYADGILKVQKRGFEGDPGQPTKICSRKRHDFRCPIEDSAHLTAFIRVQYQSRLACDLGSSVLTVMTYPFCISSLIVSAYFSRSDGSLSSLLFQEFN